MHQYNFVGVTSEIGGNRLERLGQAIWLPKEEARNAIEGGAAIVPAADFMDCGFTAEELEAYAYIGQRSQAPESFQAKYKRAIARIGVAEDEAGS